MPGNDQNGNVIKRPKTIGDVFSSESNKGSVAIISSGGSLQVFSDKKPLDVKAFLPGPEGKTSLTDRIFNGKPTPVTEGTNSLGLTTSVMGSSVVAKSGVLGLAKTTDTDPKVAEDIVSETLSAFGLQVSAFGRMINTLTTTIITSNIDLGMLGQAMKEVAPKAKAAGISFEETAAMVGMLSKAGIQDSKIGHVLDDMIFRLSRPSDEAKKVFKSLGISERKDDGRLKKVPEMMVDVFRTTEKLPATQRLDAFTSIFGQQSAAGMSNLVEESGGDFFKGYIDLHRTGQQTPSSTLRFMSPKLTRVSKKFDSVADGGVVSDLNASSKEKSGVLDVVKEIKDAWSHTPPDAKKVITTSAKNMLPFIIPLAITHLPAALTFLSPTIPVAVMMGASRLPGTKERLEENESLVETRNIQNRSKHMRPATEAELADMTPEQRKRSGGLIYDPPPTTRQLVEVRQNFTIQVGTLDSGTEAAIKSLGPKMEYTTRKAILEAYEHEKRMGLH